MKTDYLGNELKVGDTVAFMQIGYRGLMKGIIVKMSEQKATISHEKTNTCKTQSIQFYDQMVKVNTSDNTVYAVSQSSTATPKLASPASHKQKRCVKCLGG